MKVLRPIAITSAMLTSSSVPEADHAAWLSGTVYALGARVIRTTTHRIYERQAAGSGTLPPEQDDTVWLDVGPTNRWAMLDDSPSSATSAASSIAVTVAPAAAVGDIVLSGVVGASVSVQVNGATVRTVAVPAVVAPATSSNVTITALGIAAGASVGVTLTGSGTVSVAQLLLGSIVALGDTLPGAQIGITDYSTTETNAFGVTRIVRRRYSRRIQCSVRIQTPDTSRVVGVLEDLRSDVCWWIAEDGYSALAVCGMYRDWSIDIKGATETIYSITVEGLARDDVFAAPEAGNYFAPPVITGITAAMAPGGVRVSWEPSTDPEWAGVEWRVGATWAAGVRVFRGAANDFVWLAPPQGAQILWGINYDSTGGESAPVSLSLTIDGSVLIVSSGAGGNQLFGADFARGWLGWSSVNGGAPAVRGMDIAGWTLLAASPIAGNTAAIIQGAPIGNTSAYWEEWSDPVPVTPLAYYCASGYTGAHRCRGAVFAYYLDAAGVIVGNTYGSPANVDNAAEASGGSSLASYKRVFGVGQAPSTARTARVALRKYDTTPGQTTSYFFAARLMFEEVASAASTPGPWSPGPIGYSGDLDATKGAPAGTLVGGTLAQTVESNAANALQGVNDINADGKWSPVEKAALVVDWAELTGSSVPLITRANSFGIVAERDAFSAAVDALSVYLVGLAPPWNDTTTTTNIVRATADQKWADAYNTRSTLASRIDEEAGKRATWTTVTGAGKPQDNATLGATFGPAGLGNVVGQIDAATRDTYIAAGTIHESAAMTLAAALSALALADFDTPGVSANADGGCLVLFTASVSTTSSWAPGSTTPSLYRCSLYVNGVRLHDTPVLGAAVGTSGSGSNTELHGVAFSRRIDSVGPISCHVKVFGQGSGVVLHAGATLSIVALKGS